MACEKSNVIDICLHLLDDCKPGISPQLIVQKLNDLNVIIKIK